MAGFLIYSAFIKNKTGMTLKEAQKAVS